jgi:hypothetical protein
MVGQRLRPLLQAASTHDFLSQNAELFGIGTAGHCLLKTQNISRSVLSNKRDSSKRKATPQIKRHCG